MNVKVLLLIVIISCILKSSTCNECPTTCTCREEHFFDTAISRYTRHTPFQTDSHLMDNHISNNVLYDGTEIELEEGNPLLKVATCFIQAETNLEEFITTIPKNVQALSLIKSSNSGNKTLLTSYLEYFDELISFEVQGSVPVEDEDSDFIVEIDSSIVSLKYLNFDQVHIRNSKSRQAKLQEIMSQDDNNNNEILLESVAPEQKTDQESDILPYYKYKEIQKNLESSFFVDFTNLVLVRLSSCNLQNIYWEMFKGLTNLKYLILERNNLKFIPSFTFYGTPNLNSLSLAWNNLLNIHIADLAGLLELKYLDLSHNNFSELSELSFPPFPKLVVADFRDNPITIVYPNTFDVMNTTDSIILGSEDSRLQLIANSFTGLNKLIKLTINNANILVLKQELLNGMPILKELTISGNVQKIEYDAFLNVRQLEKLVLSNCNIYNVSMDSFYGLDDLIILDLSKNHLQYLPPNIFDDQKQLKELYLNGNELKELPVGIFRKIPLKLLRLNENLWHCSCAMNEWDPMMINKIKVKVSSACTTHYDKGIECKYENKYAYVYENRMAPKCNSPNKVKNRSVFQAVQKYLHCKDYNKMKYKKFKTNTTNTMPLKVIKQFDLNKHIEKNHLIVSDSSDLKRVQIQTNNEPNDLGANYKPINFEPLNSEFDHRKMIKNVYNKKKKQHMLMLAKLKRTRKE